MPRCCGSKPETNAPGWQSLEASAAPRARSKRNLVPPLNLSHADIESCAAPLLSTVRLWPLCRRTPLPG